MSPPRAKKAPKPKDMLELLGMSAFKAPKGFRGGRALRKAPGEMNKLEEVRDRELAAMKRSGEIVHYKFEAVKLRLAANTTYCPDFMVWYPDGRQIIEEVKGSWEEDARVKIKCAAENFPWEFVALTPRAKRDGGGWDRESFKGWTDEGFDDVPGRVVVPPAVWASMTLEERTVLARFVDAPLRPVLADKDAMTLAVAQNRKAIVEALCSDIPRVEASPVKPAKKRTRSEFGAVCTCLVNGKRLGDFKGCPAHYVQPQIEVVGTHANGRPLSVTNVGDDADKLF